jgi:hypothetical protein
VKCSRTISRVRLELWSNGWSPENTSLHSLPDPILHRLNSVHTFTLFPQQPFYTILPSTVVSHGGLTRENMIMN